MFKEKLYSGTYTKSSTVKTVTRIPETTTVSCNIEKTNILCDALLDFLTECGCEVSYEDESLIIYICGIPLIFQFQSTYLYYSSVYAGSCTIMSGNASYTNIFDNNGTYKFKLTLIGEPTGFFGLFISNYSLNVNYTSNCLYFVNLENILENEPYIGISSGNNQGTFYILKKDPIINIGLNSIDLKTTSYSMNDKEKLLDGNQGKYPLIPFIKGIYRLKNCYQFISTNEVNTYSYPLHTGGNFYKINDKIYMTYSNYWLVECITE